MAELQNISHHLKSPMSDQGLIQENVPLASLTTLRIGGPARFFAEAREEDELPAAFSFAEQRGLPLFILGGGSNALVADEGFPGLVVHVALKGVTWRDEGDRVVVIARAGEDWDEFVSQCVERDLAGVECLSGIPGSVGGTPIQNVGAYGQAVSEIRARKAMLISPGDPDCRSAGSFFKNPVVTSDTFTIIEEIARGQNLIGAAEAVPNFPAGDGRVKVPAAWLIERAGFQKGYSRGRVGISSKHTLAIVNRGGATAREVIGLRKEIQERVAAKFGVPLTPEPVFVGFDPPAGKMKPMGEWQF